MKKPITLVLALLTFASVAQYNNTYDVNLNSDKLTPSFVITNKKAESITVSYASDAGSPRLDYFILTKLKQNGVVMYDNRFDPANWPNDGLTNVEALIQTDDDGVLVAGYHYDDAHFIEQPFLLKVDVNGNFMWSKIYYVNQRPMVNSQINKISLCRVANDSDENYFIVGTGDSDINPGQDVATNVIKVDQNGNMIFSKKYYDTNPQFSITREYPGDIEFSKPDQLFMITGYREDVDQAGTHNDLMYYFGIDNLGNVLTKFLTLASKSIPLDQDMIFDPNKKVFATVFTHEKDGYVQGTSSVIGFITIDAALTYANPSYIWHKEASAHNGRSISLSLNGDYVLCSGVLDNTIYFSHNPAWLKIDPAANPTTKFMRYNIKDDVYFGHHATWNDPSAGKEEHVLVSEQKTDLRVISTDINGDACGAVKYDPFSKLYNPGPAYYRYDFKDVGKPKDYKVHQTNYNPPARKCTPPGTSYRTTGIAKISSAEGMINVYPSVMSSANAYLTVENNFAANVKMEVRNISGQLIFSNNQIVPGKTEVKLNANENLPVGIYMLNICSADGQLNAATKIIISE